MRIALLIYQGTEQPLVSASLSLSLPLPLICVKRPAVSNHSLSVTLNLICKCDTWGQSPVLRVCPATTHAPLRLVRALSRYFWMSLFSLCCSVTAGNRTSANCKLSHRPQMLPVHVYNKPYKREFTKTKQQKAFVNLPAEVTNADGNKSISISFSPLDNVYARNWSLVQISPWNVANISCKNTHTSIEDCIDWRRSQQPCNNDSRGWHSGMSNIWHFKTEKLRSWTHNNIHIFRQQTAGFLSVSPQETQENLKSAGKTETGKCSIKTLAVFFLHSLKMYVSYLIFKNYVGQRKKDRQRKFKIIN